LFHRIWRIHELHNPEKSVPPTEPPAPAMAASWLAH
jgi:hypothetical protein